MSEPEVSRFEPVPFEPHEREIHRLLGLMGGAPADQYADAIRILRGTPPLQTRSHLLAHMAREIESALRELLWSLVPAEVRKKLEAEKPEKRRDPDRALVIDAICSALGFDGSDPVRSLWNNSGAWHEAAHRAALLAPRPTDDALIARWEQLGAVLKVVLRAYEGSYTRALPMIDELAAADPVTKPDVSRLLSQVPNSAPALNRFFEQATPAWFPQLLKKGYFQSPAPLRPNEDGLLTYGHWPPGRYLVRMMEVPDLVRDVIDVVSQLETDNPQATETIADVALAAPIALVRPLARKIAQLLQSPAQWALPSKATELLPKLAADGQLDEAAAILAEMLPAPTRRGAGGGFIPPDLVSRLFPQIGVPGLTAVAARLAQKQEDVRDELNHSHRWWPSITSDKVLGARDELVTMLRDAAVAVAADAGPTEVVRVLDTHPGGIFRRLALHVLLITPEPASISQRLTDPILFHDRDCFVEYGQLLRSHFAGLQPEERARITTLVDEGPTNTDDPAAIQRWRLRQLTRFGDALPEPYLADRDALVQELGEPDIANQVFEFKVRNSTDLAIMPLPVLDDMSDDDLISFLTSWTPTGRWDDPDTGDLRQRIEAAATRNPHRFAELAPRFINLDPTYARGLLAGLRQAIESTDEQDEPASPIVAWEPVLLFASASLSQRRLLPGRPEHGDGEQDPGWSWTWRELAELITAGLRSDLPEALLDRAFALIGQLLDDQDPSDTDTDSTNSTDNPPLAIALSSTRGNAWLALLQYAIRLHDPAAPMLDPAISHLLDRHLDPATETSPAIRSLYGHKINILRELDEPWTSQHIPQIFPHTTEPGVASVAWNTYLLYGRISALTVRLLLPLYEQHAAALTESPELAPSTDGRWQETPEEHLVQHLALLYRHGALPTEADWFDQFSEHAPLRPRARLIEIMGLQLGEPGPLEPDETERLQGFWNKRLNAVAQAGGNAAELNGFGYWFTSGQLPADWALAQLNHALAAGATLTPGDDIAERLATFGPEASKDTVTAVAGLIDAPDRPWFITGARAAIADVLRTGLQAAEPETRGLARQAISRLVARGHSSFADL
ncbi:hypothetical protein [Actinoplanes sp. NPDC026619]|uniref:hypothetical protein n=1 Tax=Actinoplanes sp. NPDC026619 TaxID=3155798 RepID=UPI00340D6505